MHSGRRSLGSSLCRAARLPDPNHLLSQAIGFLQIQLACPLRTRSGRPVDSRYPVCFCSSTGLDNNAALRANLSDCHLAAYAV